MIVSHLVLSLKMDRDEWKRFKARIAEDEANYKFHKEEKRLKDVKDDVRQYKYKEFRNEEKDCTSCNKKIE